MPQFETFTKTLVARHRDPHITVQRRGTITMNAAAFAALDSPLAVELLFDREDRVLGLRSCDPALDHAAFVRPATRSPNGPYVVSAMAFLKHYEVDTREARRYPVTVRKAVLCADLAGPFQPVSKRTVTSVGADTDAHADSKDTTHRPRPRPVSLDG